jgi:hypothetical protein
MKTIPSKESILLAIAAASLGFAGREAIDESEVQNKIEIQKSVSKKVLIDGETRFVAPLEFSDGGKFDVLLTEAPCVLPFKSEDGGEDEVDCLCQDGSGAEYRWKGRNVCPKEWSTGTQCTPSACSVTSGRDESDLY